MTLHIKGRGKMGMADRGQAVAKSKKKRLVVVISYHTQFDINVRYWTTWVVHIHWIVQNNSAKETMSKKVMAKWVEVIHLYYWDSQVVNSSSETDQTCSSICFVPIRQTKGVQNLFIGYPFKALICRDKMLWSSTKFIPTKNNPVSKPINRWTLKKEKPWRKTNV